MATSFVPLQLVHAHLPPTPSIPHAIPTLRIPTERSFPSDDAALSEPLHPEHAISTAYNGSTGILARSIHNGYVLELRTVSTVISKDSSADGPGSEIIRIYFPDVLCALVDSCIMPVRREGKVFILVATRGNIIYRLAFPFGNFRPASGDRFLFSTAGGDEWSEEYEIPEEVLGAEAGIESWTVLDQDILVLGGADGGIVKLSRTHRGKHAEWTAAAHRAPSKFRLPLFSRSGSDEQVIATATSVHLDSAPLVYAMSRNAQLRVWNSASGSCMRTIDARSALNSTQDLVLRDGRQSPTTSSSGSFSQDSFGAPLIRCIPHPSTSSRYSHILITYVATPQDPSSAGTFAVFRVSLTGGTVDLAAAGSKRCSERSAGAQMRSFEVLAPTERTGGSTGWKLFVAWDRQGSVACETIIMDDIFQFTTYVAPSVHAPLLFDWQAVSVDDEVEQYDAAYFDSLISPDCPNPAIPEDNTDIAATFVSHLSYPGRFSSLSLETAMEEYTAGLPRSLYDATLSAQYPNLAVKYTFVVGSHLRLSLDPSTGAPKVEAFRQELKLDWLGVWARVRDLDKQARWPVSTAIVDAQITIFAREGLSAAIPQDDVSILHRFGADPEGADDFTALPSSSFAQVHPSLADSQVRAALSAITAAGSTLSSILSGQQAADDAGSALDPFTVLLDTSLAGGLQQPVEDIASTLWAEQIEPYLNEDDLESVRRQLSGALQLKDGLSSLLSLLSAPGNFASGAAIADLAFSGFGNALLASGLAQSVAARYEVASGALLVALLHMAESDAADDETEQGDDDVDTAELLSECFVVYHRCRVLKWITEQTGQEAATRAKKDKRDKKRKANHAEDALAEGLGGLRMKNKEGGSDTDGVDPSYSLVHSLLARRIPQDVSRSAINTLYQAIANTLRSIGTLGGGGERYELEAISNDAKLAYAVLSDGHPTSAGELTALYPLNAAMAYVKGRAYAELGVVDESVKSFEQAMSGVRDGTLTSIISGLDGADPVATYLRHLVQVYSDLGQDGPVAHFGQLALRTGEEGSKDADIWTRVFLANIALRQYEEAYSVLASAPFLDLKRDFLGQLISVMCEQNEVGRLNSLGFVGMQKDVEALLSYKARNSDPLRFPNYYKVLYSWHISRGDYRSAGEIMFLQARRLGGGSSQRVPDYELATMQARSYLASINALSLVDKRNAWIAVPSPASDSARRRRVTSYIPAEDFAQDRRPVDIVNLRDIEQEYTLVLFQLRLAAQIKEILGQGVSLTSEEVVGLLVKEGQFDAAQSAASTLGVDMTGLFTALATRCVELSRNADLTLDSSSAAFLRSSNMTTRLQGPPAALCLRYLEISLKRHDTAATQHRYREAVADTFFKLNDDERYLWVMPAWLVDGEMERDPEGWIGRALKWGWTSEAAGWTETLISRMTPPELVDHSKAAAVLVPYNLADRALCAAESWPRHSKFEDSLLRRVNALSDLMKAS